MQVRFARHTDRLAEIVRFYREGLGLREIGSFENHDSVEAVTETCERTGAPPVESANPYWKAHGVTLIDPDGFRVVLVPDSWAG